MFLIFAWKEQFCWSL